MKLRLQWDGGKRTGRIRINKVSRRPSVWRSFWATRAMRLRRGRRRRRRWTARAAQAIFSAIRSRRPERPRPVGRRRPRSSAPRPPPWRPPSTRCRISSCCAGGSGTG